MKLACPEAGEGAGRGSTHGDMEHSINSKEQFLRVVRGLFFVSLLISVAFDGFYVTLYVVIFFTDISPLTSAVEHPYHREKLAVSCLALVATLAAAVACIRECVKWSVSAVTLLFIVLVIHFVMCVTLYDPMDLMDCVLAIVTSAAALCSIAFAVAIKRNQII